MVKQVHYFDQRELQVEKGCCTTGSNQHKRESNKLHCPSLRDKLEIKASNTTHLQEQLSNLETALDSWANLVNSSLICT